MDQWDHVGWLEHGENQLWLSKSLWSLQAGQHPSCQGACQKAQGLGDSSLQSSSRLNLKYSAIRWFTPGQWFNWLISSILCVDWSNGRTIKRIALYTFLIGRVIFMQMALSIILMSTWILDSIANWIDSDNVINNVRCLPVGDWSFGEIRPVSQQHNLW